MRYVFSRSVSRYLVLGLALLGLGLSPCAPALAGAPKYTIRLAHNETMDDPIHQGMVVFKDLIEARSNGQVKVEIYPTGKLGSGQANADQLAANQLEIGIIFYTFLTGYVPWVALGDYPFSMPDMEQTWRIYDEKILPATNKALAEKGIIMLGGVSAAYKTWLSYDPLRKPEDFKNKKYRTSATGIAPTMVKTWGGRPVVIPWAEAFTGFEQRIFDVMDVPVAAAVTFHFYDIAKYAIKSDFVYATFTACVSKKWFEGLPPDIQSLVKETLRIGIDHANAGRARLAADAYRILADKGVKVIYLTEKEKEVFKASLQPVLNYAISTYGEDKVNLFLKH
jgi:TRAP-type C4-dicarboxylate transport system substrate-binding protein